MSDRCLIVLLVSVAFVCGAVVSGVAQTQTDRADSKTSLTPWGHPNLQGTWTNTTTTPLQRPIELGEKALLSDEERAALDEERSQTEQHACANTSLPPIVGYARTSTISTSNEIDQQIKRESWHITSTFLPVQGHGLV